jgi:hypothetical protein
LFILSPEGPPLLRLTICDRLQILISVAALLLVCGGYLAIL